MSVREPWPHIVAGHLRAHGCEVLDGVTVVAYHDADCALAEAALDLHSKRSGRVLFIDLHHPDRTAMQFAAVTACNIPLTAVPHGAAGESDAAAYGAMTIKGAERNRYFTCALLRRPSSSSA